MLKKFQRKIEDFTCEHCQAFVKGNGYTNHCPHCLWSKHVDINPGDRQEICQGLMEPIFLENKGEDWIIVYRCVQCGFKRKNKRAKEDNLSKFLELGSFIG